MQTCGRPLCFQPSRLAGPPPSLRTHSSITTRPKTLQRLGARVRRLVALFCPRPRRPTAGGLALRPRAVAPVSLAWVLLRQPRVRARARGLRRRHRRLRRQRRPNTPVPRPRMQGRHQRNSGASRRKTGCQFFMIRARSWSSVQCPDLLLGPTGRREEDAGPSCRLLPSFRRPGRPGGSAPLGVSFFANYAQLVHKVCVLSNNVSQRPKIVQEHCSATCANKPLEPRKSPEFAVFPG